MKISVIVPVYNVEKYLRKCLDSLVNQTYKDLEIIVVNDGSPDNSKDIIKEYENNYSNIKTINKENEGLGSARNDGVKIATGEYISFVDSDDFLPLDFYERIVKSLEKFNSDIVLCGIKDCFEDNDKIKDNYLPFNEIVDIKEAFIKSNPSAVNKVYKKELVKGINFINGLWYEDVPYSLYAISLSNKISYVKDTLYNYFHRKVSIMNNTNINKNLDIIKVFDYLIKELKEANKYEELIEEINYSLMKEIYISSVVRVIRTKTNVDKLEVINKLKAYVKSNIKDFKNNKYYKTMSKKDKLLIKLIDLKLYSIIKLMFKIKEKI